MIHEQMPAEELRRALRSLQIMPRAAARRWGATPRRMQRWVSGSDPVPIWLAQKVKSLRAHVIAYRVLSQAHPPLAEPALQAIAHRLEEELGPEWEDVATVMKKLAADDALEETEATTMERTTK